MHRHLLLFITVTTFYFSGTSQSDYSKIQLLLPHPELIGVQSYFFSQNDEFVVLTTSNLSKTVFSVYRTRDHQLVSSNKFKTDSEGFKDLTAADVSNDGQFIRIDREYEPIFVYNTLTNECVPYSTQFDSLFTNDYTVDSHTWPRDGYSFHMHWYDGYVEATYPDGDTLRFDRKLYKICCPGDEDLRISPDRKHFGISEKGIIRIYNIANGALIWESPKQEMWGDFHLMENGIIVCNNALPKSGKGLQWYNYLEKELIFSTLDEPFGSLNYLSQVDHVLVLAVGDPTKKNVKYIATINLKTGATSYLRDKDYTNKEFNSLIKDVRDSLKMSDPESYEHYISNYQYNYHASVLWSQCYNKEGDQKKPCQMDYAFFESFDTTYASYTVFYALDNHVTYQDRTGDMPMFNVTYLRKELLFWNGNMPEEERQVRLIVSENQGPFFYSPDLYYMGSGDLSKIIDFKVDDRIYHFDQFDLKYNRPDIIMERLGYADSNLINAYYRAYQKRLKKMDFDEGMLQDDFHVPDMGLTNKASMPLVTDQTSVQLDLKMADTKHPLKRINVWINGVAIYGSEGLSIAGTTNELDTTLSVNLARGTNVIECSVLNNAGAESFKQTVKIDCNKGKEKPDLYLITIGAGKFEQSTYNLTYAAKDARDVATVFASSQSYGTIFNKTLINEEVTKANITELRSFLHKADINDQVIIFLAGHGVLDKELDYYFSTYDMDFTHPKEKGLAYSELEQLIDGIAPLKKTIWIDACHSGEIDKDDVVLTNNTESEDGTINFRGVGSSASPKLGLKNTSELTRSLFSDLRKGTGATVISSAGGLEFAMEGQDWQNGLFTYCLLKGIKTMDADFDKNGEIWLSELKMYVSEQVVELSGGRQQPTSRIENQSIDLRIF